MNRKIISKILMLLLLVLFLLLAFVLILEVKQKEPEKTEKSEAEVLTPTPQDLRPSSRWATDSAVLAIEGNLKNLSGEIEGVDLKQSNLLPPILDVQVKF